MNATVGNKINGKRATYRLVTSRNEQDRSYQKDKKGVAGYSYQGAGQKF